MESTITLAPVAVPAKSRVWTGRILAVLAVPFLLMDAGIHIAKPAPVVEASEKLGYSLSVMPPLGIVELLCTILYVIPRTAVVGAVLLTGYLGGAVATHVRVGDPFYFPFIVGALLWGSLYLRDARVRQIFASRNQ